MYWLATSLLLIAIGQAYAAADNNYIEYLPGSPGSRIILSVPHGGDLTPDEIPDRQHGCYNNMAEVCNYTSLDCGDRDAANCRMIDDTDSHVKNYTIMLQKELHVLLGNKPHVIICNLKRTKLDANREKALAAQGNPVAEEAWDTFMNYIQISHDAVLKNGYGIHFDIHGQSHQDKWLELGYLISKDQLNAGVFYPNQSSILTLANRSNFTFEDLIYGNVSLGGFMSQKEIKVVPSPQYPKPRVGDFGSYFSGGYLTRRWGSYENASYNIDAIQLELHYKLREDCIKSGKCNATSESLADFVTTHYGSSVGFVLSTFLLISTIGHTLF